jgi:hypothetical protein
MVVKPAMLQVIRAQKMYDVCIIGSGPQAE